MATTFKDILRGVPELILIPQALIWDLSDDAKGTKVYLKFYFIMFLGVRQF